MMPSTGTCRRKASEGRREGGNEDWEMRQFEMAFNLLPPMHLEKMLGVISKSKGIHNLERELTSNPPLSLPSPHPPYALLPHNRDFDGRLSKPELLQGLAQQGFHNLEGTREFELLWGTCEKITTSDDGGGGEEEEAEGVGGPELAGAGRVAGGGGGKGGRVGEGKEGDERKDENRITFAAFKRIVQRLKMELLFLPDMCLRGGAGRSYTGGGVGREGRLGGVLDSRSCTPVPYGAPLAAVSVDAVPAVERGGEGAEWGVGGTGGEGSEPVMVAPAPRLLSGLGGGVHTSSNNTCVILGGGGMGGAAGAGGEGGEGGRITPGLPYPDYGTATPAYSPIDDHEGEGGREGGREAGGNGRMELVKFSSVDYNEKRYAAEIPVADTYAFFTAHRDPKDFMMRWLHLEGIDRYVFRSFPCPPPLFHLPFQLHMCIFFHSHTHF